MSLSASCRLFGVSRQSVYKHFVSLQKTCYQSDIVAELVRRYRMRLPRVGTRKLHYLLRDDFEQRGLKIGRDKLFSYLRQQHLLIRPFKTYTKTTQSKHWLRRHPNLVREYKPQAAEQLWVSDITYIPTRQQTCYLSLVTDAFSRKIMGYCLSLDLRTEHMLSALKMAIRNKKTDRRTIHHSDRGLQYCTSNQIRCSMTDGYDCYQNALAERMNGILKMEFLHTKHNDYESISKSVKESIQAYNTIRPHSSLRYMTPEQAHEKSLADESQGSGIIF